MEKTIEILYPSSVNEALQQGRLIYDGFNSKNTSERDFYDDACSNYIGMLIWYLKIKGDKLGIEDVVSLENLKAIVNIEVTAIPLILLCVEKDFNFNEILPIEFWIDCAQTKTIASLTSITSTLFVNYNKKNTSNSSIEIISIIATDVKNNFKLIDKKFTLLYRKDLRASSQEMTSLDLWLKSHI